MFTSALLLSHVHYSNDLQSQTAHVYYSECFLTASSLLSVFCFLLPTANVIKFIKNISPKCLPTLSNIEGHLALDL